MKPTKEEIRNRIVPILEDLLGVDAAECNDASNLIQDLGADSLDNVEFVMNCEKEFNIAISDDVSENLHTVGDVVEAIYKLTNQ